MSDAAWMTRALELARRGQGSTAPNPSVGAVIVRDGQVLGQGFTRPAGQEHAEIVALEQARAAGHELRGATMYVTLEPCCHQGRTPPCTDAILEAGIGRVVAGVTDPFPPMQGRSLEILRQAGVQVELGVLGERCAQSVQGFVRAVHHGLPWVIAKAGISLDGHIATASGDSRWITGPEARAHGHGLRATCDAIMVGIGTVLADDPRLTTRGTEGSDPMPVVLDSGLRIPADARLFQSAERPLVLCAPDAPSREAELAADVVRIPRGEGGLDPEAVMRAVVARGKHSVLLEGGGQVHRSMLDARLVDELLVYLAGLIVPGGIPWVGGPAIQHLSEAIRVEHMEIERLGADFLLRCRLPHRTAGE